MNIIGIWKVSESQSYNPAIFGMEWKKLSEQPADNPIVQFNRSLAWAFTEDGKVLHMCTVESLDLTPEKIEAGIQEGFIKKFGDTLYGCDKVTEWKEQDGKILFDNGERGTMFDKPIDPWKEIIETEDGIQFGTYRLVRAD